MTILSDKDIKKAIEKGELEIKGVNFDDITCASIDCHLGNQFRIFKH